MKLYQLTNKEVDTATRFAVNLIAAGKRGTIESHLIGTLGEMGYAKHINSKVNLEVYQKGKGDGGSDFEGIQVKTATWPHDNKQLKINIEDGCLENITVNKFILMHTTLKARTKVYLVGEISKENFLKKAELNIKYNYLTLSEYDLDVHY
jgi:hypothetical protein